ncbi:transcriptional regulator [Longibacter salinarum]|uniref:Transcriptional regulator n=1 Tax=Longibacter salinarum TaxID=1850348 RepID=A0A2A8D0Z2_9BACT|nr:metallophosphoesterase [Longibacter salinarum]PEN14632.1 transcriptional regulator [Longibacter salinarum]
MKIAHVSDPHFGRIAHPGIVDALVEEINERPFDLVAISGDLTQRARPSEFAAATSMIERFEAPVIVVPGNHDVYPWWRPFRRMLTPLKRYRSLVSTDMTPSVVNDRIAVLGINSAHGRTIKGGRIGEEERQTVKEFFEQVSHQFKILVLHHHLTQIQALGPHDVARQAEATLEVAADAGVNLILCGHLHISHVEPLEIVPNERRIVIASAGTATSTRGRGSNRKTNFYNRIDIEPERFQIEERRYVPESGRFVSDNQSVFDRLVPRRVS